MFKKVTIYLTKDRKKKKTIWIDDTLTGFDYYEPLRKKYLFWHSIE
jgi:hypothetical protein